MSRKCVYCKDTFVTRNLERHIIKCIKEKNTKLLSEDKHRDCQSEYNDNDNQYGDAEYSEINSESDVSSDNEDNINEDLVSDGDFDELVQHFSIDVHPQTTIKRAKLVSLLCIFLGLWQYIFGITDTAIACLLNFLDAFFSVIQKSVSFNIHLVCFLARYICFTSI